VHFQTFWHVNNWCWQLIWRFLRAPFQFRITATKLTITPLLVDDLTTCSKMHNNRLEVSFEDLLKLLVGLESRLPTRQESGFRLIAWQHIWKCTTTDMKWNVTLSLSPSSVRADSSDSKLTRSLSRSPKPTSNLLLWIFKHVLRSSTDNIIIVSLVINRLSSY